MATTRLPCAAPTPAACSSPPRLQTHLAHPQAHQPSAADQRSGLEPAAWIRPAVPSDRTPTAAVMVRQRTADGDGGRAQQAHRLGNRRPLAARSCARGSRRRWLALASVSSTGERAQAEVCCWCQHKRLELSRALARATRACTSRIARTMSERQLRVGPAARQQAKMRQQQTRLAHPHRAIPQMTGKAQSSSVGGCDVMMAPGTFAADLSARVRLHAVGGATIQPF